MIPQTFQKKFTLRTANQTLPLVRSITSEIVQLATEVEETRQRLDYLNESRDSRAANDIYGNELESIEKHNDSKSDHIDSCIDELGELEVVTDTVIRGYVDFPAKRLNDDVCLCWKLGEREVKYWHASNEDCSLRRPIDLELIRQSGEMNFTETA